MSKGQNQIYSKNSMLMIMQAGASLQFPVRPFVISPVMTLILLMSELLIACRGSSLTDWAWHLSPPQDVYANDSSPW